ncbi:hypothetical protein ACHAPF_009512 [Botrytis cinerea]
MPRPHSHHIVKKSSDEIPHSLKRARNDRKITANAADAAERQADAAKDSRAAEQQSSEAAKQRSSEAAKQRSSEAAKQ